MKKNKDDSGRLAAIVDSTDVAIIDKTLDGIISSWNRAAERLFGYTESEAVGRPLAMLIPPGCEQEECDILSRIVRGERVGQFETVRRRKDGRLLDLAVSICPIRDAGGKIIGASKFAYDLTSRKRAEAALRESDELRRQIIASVAEGVIAFDLELRYTIWNPYMEMLTGISAEHILGRRLQDVFPVVRSNGRLELIQRALLGESVNLPDAQPISGASTTSWTQTRVSPLRNARGEITGVIATLRDVTERKSAEDALRLTRFTMERAALGIFWVESDGKIADVNDAACAMLGYTRAELLALSVRDIDPDVANVDWYEQRKRLKRTGTLLIESHHRTKDGHVFPVEVASNFIVFGERELNCAFVRDISGRKQAEEAVRSSEERYRLIVETAEEGIWMVDEKFMTSFANPKMAQMLGTTVEEMRWRPLFDYVDEADRPAAMRHLEWRRQGLREQYEFKYKRRDGTFLWAAVAANPVYDSNGRYIGSLRMVSDITERKRTAELLSRSREDLRALAARLESAREEECVRIAREAHDELGQNLTAVKMELSGLRKSLAASKDRGFKAPLLEKIDSISKMLSGTVASVRRICSELRPSALDDIGLTAAIESHALQFQARSGVRCSLTLSAEPIAADAARSTVLFRIFQEILTNVARHAHASRITVSLKPAEGHAVLEVVDNGRGFAESAVRERKSLGLLGMRERALAVGGTVDIQSVPKKGTTVTVRIPIETTM